MAGDHSRIRVEVANIQDSHVEVFVCGEHTAFINAGTGTFTLEMFLVPLKNATGIFDNINEGVKYGVLSQRLVSMRPVRSECVCMYV